jgi:hypothetical protein
MKRGKKRKCRAGMENGRRGRKRSKRRESKGRNGEVENI